MKDVVLHTGFRSDYPMSVKPFVRPQYLQKHLPIFRPTGLRFDDCLHNATSVYTNSDDEVHLPLAI